MTQKHFNALSILQSHKDIVDKLSLVAIGSDFVDNLPSRSYRNLSIDLRCKLVDWFLYDICFH